MEDIILNIQRALRSEAKNATFAVGGHIPINTGGETGLEVDADEKTSSRTARTAEPVQIRFGESGKGVTLTLPTEKKHSNTPSPSFEQTDGRSGVSHELQQLLKACAPATFGRNGDEVHDEAYRKAGKLDTTAFTTSFCPYQLGIMDVVQQVLMPYNWIRKGNLGIRAELYKLNAYSGPSGLFKPHVDTPRDETQIGSLVIGLPVEHQGGQLAVRHTLEGFRQEVVFDWSQTSEDPPVVHWAAFYSDCEHEVLQVTSGHRITLTYNLFSTTASGHLAGKSNALDPTKLPLYKSLKAALASQRFFPRGHLLGVNLAHHYGHTSETDNFLPHSLKGADMVLYEIFRALKLPLYLLPLHDSHGDEQVEELLGRKFWPFELMDEFEEGEEIVAKSDFLETVCDDLRDKVVWLNYAMADTKAVQAVFLTHGNEPCMNVMYTKAVMIVKVPPFGRHGRKTFPEDEAIFESEGSSLEESDEESDGNDDSSAMNIDATLLEDDGNLEHEDSLLEGSEGKPDDDGDTSVTDIDATPKASEHTLRGRRP
ncbi:hypothetical protein PRZ48_012202 [Zasmidium cellare]|uniref:Fe2OG dioxygenase domain-containing protein n=1 Tax=Zasmidium cellare TaxID=395010 RepID=A0ABR0E497_ZASCE|nr:hypothetical protein PRZ48_012202 [Zasmidium cellare]